MTIIVPIGPEIAQDALTQNLARAQEIANAGAGSAGAQDRFVFVASFDGTNNDQDKDLPEEEQSTNVWQLHQQITQSANQEKGYYPGPGTSAALRHSSWLPSAVTEQVIKAANDAYAEFAEAASRWAKANPGNNQRGQHPTKGVSIN